jgi:hypothetical protein
LIVPSRISDTSNVVPPASTMMMSLSRSSARAGQRRHRRAGLRHVDRLVRRVVDMDHAAGRRADQQLAAEPRAQQVAFQQAQMLLHQRF